MIPFSTKSALLQALLKGPGRPSELIQRINELTGGEVVLHDGAVYPALASLEEEGSVETEPRRGYDGKILKSKNYKLTRHGKRQVRRDQQLVAKVFGLRKK